MKRSMAFKYRLDPTPSQEACLRMMVGHARFVWNAGLRECLSLREKGEYIPNYEGMCRWITAWKKDPELLWLKDAYTDNLQQKLKDLSNAWKRCFDASLDALAPRFKKKGKSRDSIRFVNFKKYCKLEHRWVHLPNGLGWVRYRESRKIQGDIKNCTVSFQGGHWHISFQVEIEIEETPVHPSTSATGLDLGLACFTATSEGDLFEPLNSLRRAEEKLANEQRKLKNKVKFSNNWQKQKRLISKLHVHVANCRRDYLHKLSHWVCKNHAMIAMEGLKVSNMSASAKGTLEAPGRNVKAKSGLNKSILDQGWHEFRRQVGYKQEWRGGMLVVVPPQYTSQTCPECGRVDAENRKTRAQFLCVACGHAEHADIVGARNVLARAHEQLSGQDIARSACEVNGAVRPSAAGTLKPSDGLNTYQDALAS